MDSPSNPVAVPALPVARILAGGAIAPWLLGVRFWLRASPLIALLVLAPLALAIVGSPLPLPWVLYNVALVLPATLVLVPFHRAVLSLEGGGPWWGMRETRYAFALLALMLLTSFSTYAVLGIAGPLVAAAVMVSGASSVGVGILGVFFGVLAAIGWIWLVAPLALVLPAIAAGHPATPARAWRLARGRRWRIAMAVAAYPVLSRLIPVHLFALTLGWVVSPVLIVVSGYLTLALLGSVSLIYSGLSDEPLPAGPPAALCGLASHSAVRWVVPAAFLWAILGLGGLWALTVMPGLDRGPSRQEEAAVDPRLIEREEQFLTMEKHLVVLRYSLRWQVADQARYEISTGASPRRVAHYAENLVNDVLRETVASRQLDALEAGAAAEELMPRERLDEYLSELGVEVVETRIITLKRLSR